MPAHTGLRRQLARLSQHLLPLGLAAAVLGMLELAAGAGLLPISVPAPSAVAQAFVRDHAMLWPHLAPTLQAIAGGFALALAVATVLAVLATLARTTRDPIYNAAIVVQAMPLIALTPILIIWLGNGLAPRIVVTALASFFPILVGLLQGLRACERGMDELFTVMAASRWQRLRMLLLPNALPFAFSGLKVAAASAVLGAIVSEWTGATQGVGTMMAYAMFSFKIEQVWMAVILCVLLAVAAYGLVHALERRFVRWEAVAVLNAGSASLREGGPRRVLHVAAWSIACMALLLAGWSGLIHAFSIPPYLLPSPQETFATFQATPQIFASNLGFTLRTAGLGLGACVLSALLVAGLFIQLPALERTLMPFVIAVRSAPMVAIAPLITLSFGRNLLSGVIVVWMACFFPMLVNAVRGFQGVRSTHLELMRVNAASAWQTFAMLRFPFAIPHLFTGIRVAAPKAVLAAMLSEWLTGARGLGHLILESSAMMELPTLWAAILLSVATGLAVFWLTDACERKVQK
ncbi:MAG: ABC transporter permease [Moraxellaceae bacterium]|nr:ABC transporter permease [Moraxellaceae bacterium]